MEKLIERFKNKPWDFEGLSQHEKLTADIIIKFPNLPWNFNSMSKNVKLSLELMGYNGLGNLYKYNKYMNSKFYKWDWDLLSKHTKIILKHCNWNWDLLSENENIDWQMVQSNLDKPWNWYKISKHKNINFSIIKNYSWLPWDWRGVSLNPNITEEIIFNNIHFKWDIDSLCKNSNNFFKIILGCPNNDWNYDQLSSNEFINDIFNMGFSLDYILSLKWNWYEISKRIESKNLNNKILQFINFDGISKNEKISEEQFQFLIENYAEKLNWNELSRNKKITLKIVKQFIKMPWNWDYLSMISDVSENELNWNWNWDLLSKNKNILKLDLNKIKEKINWKNISRNEMLSLEIVKNFQHLNWDYKELSHMNFLNFLFILNNLDKDWDWDILSFVFGFEILNSNSLIETLPLNWEMLSQNENLTFELIEKYHDKIDWKKLSWNKLRRI